VQVMNDSSSALGQPTFRRASSRSPRANSRVIAAAERSCTLVPSWHELEAVNRGEGVSDLRKNLLAGSLGFEILERVTGIEPAFSAWETDLAVSLTCAVQGKASSAVLTSPTGVAP